MQGGAQTTTGMSNSTGTGAAVGTIGRPGFVSPQKTMMIAPVKKITVEHQRYLDKMSEALNKNMEKNIFPNWRNHQSMKGNNYTITVGLYQ